MCAGSFYETTILKDMAQETSVTQRHEIGEIEHSCLCLLIAEVGVLIKKKKNTAFCP
jgi:hypothetical protein